jgi:hypothetical protein
VENLQLTQTEIEDISDSEDRIMMSSNFKVENQAQNLNVIEQSNIINCQELDIAIKTAYNDEEIESDEELHKL